LKFEELYLDPRIMAGVKNAGYTTPTPIQEQAIPAVLQGDDVLGLAQTGTGKTAAFMLPILERLTQGPLRRTRALIIAPTRELAEQIHQTAVDLGKNTKIRSAAVYGGVGKMPQINAMQKGTEIIVACPGRLLDHIGDGNIDLRNIEVLVLDEADRMCDMGFLPDIRRILKHLPKRRQTLFFSATMPPDIRTLSSSILNDPVTVQIGMIAPAETVSHALYPVPYPLKKNLLFSILEQTSTDRVLIFARTKRRARYLAADLKRKGYNAASLQGNMSQSARQKAIDGFRSGKFDMLVATDIAARGIDVSEISHVINFDIPDTADAYTHRIGRTGRATNQGEAFTLTVEEDEPMVREIEKVLGMTLERRGLPDFDYGNFEPALPPQRGYANRTKFNSQQPRSGGRRPQSRNGARSGQSRSRPPRNNDGSTHRQSNESRYRDNSSSQSTRRRRNR